MLFFLLFEFLLFCRSADASISLSHKPGTISAYTGPDMKTVHAKLGITPSAFNAFNSELLNVLASKGVSSTDIAAVSSLLVCDTRSHHHLFCVLFFINCLFMCFSLRAGCFSYLLLLCLAVF
jgi:hypothetical protein